MKPFLIGLAFVLAHLICTTQPTQAQPTYLAVGNAKTKQAVVAFSSTSDSYSQQIQKTILADLQFLDLFKTLTSGLPQDKIVTFSQVQMPEWLKAGIDYLTYANLTLEGTKKITLEFHVVSISAGKEVLAKRYTAETSDIKTLSHTLADDLVLAITGKKGIFQTKIAFVCDKTGKKEIYSMNFDGSDVRQLTRFQSISMAPTWSPDGTKIAFSIFNKHSDNTKNIDLYELNFSSGKLQLLSNKKGINSGANYHPNGRELTFTMSHTGNPEIYILNLASKHSTQITKSVGFDVDPRFSPDGNKIAFVSSRAGKPMVYVMPTHDSSSAKRLTYAGQYNATPAWMPDGKSIVFAGWLDKHFDLFRINLANDQIDRLTKDEGNNEDPSISPDGSFLTFSSNRTGSANIWIMSSDAKFAKRLTFGMGACVAPQWSPYL